jgi:hypothetical protein
MPSLQHEEPVMARVGKWVQGHDPKRALQALDERMGFPAESARRSAWQFLQCKVPRLENMSSVRRRVWRAD